MGKEKCEICGKEIDKTDITKSFSVISIMGQFQTKRKRIYLCDEHTPSLAIWINEKVLKRLDKDA